MIAKTTTSWNRLAYLAPYMGSFFATLEPDQATFAGAEIPLAIFVDNLFPARTPPRLFAFVTGHLFMVLEIKSKLYQKMWLCSERYLNYEVHTSGVVRDTYFGNVIIPKRNRSGYLTVYLPYAPCRCRKRTSEKIYTHTVHTVVAAVHLPPP